MTDWRGRDIDLKFDGCPELRDERGATALRFEKRKLKAHLREMGERDDRPGER